MTTQAPAFTAWLDEFFAAYYRRRPVNATFIGRHEYDGQLPDYSEQGAGDTLAEIQTLLKRLHALPPETLGESEALDRKLAEGYLEIQEWEFTSTHFQRGNPTLYTGEAIFGVMALFLGPHAPLAQRVESAISRLEQTPSFLAQARANVRRAPAGWIERAHAECTGALAFLGEGVDLLVQAEAIRNPGLRRAADTAATAFADYQHHLEVELRPHATEAYACGEEVFDLLLHKGHFLEMDSAAVIAQGEAAFAACLAGLQAHAGEFGARTWQEAVAQQADHHPTVEKYSGRYQEVSDACRALAEQHRLVTWPDRPVMRYAPIPVWARKAAPYLYFVNFRPPALYDRLPVTTYMFPPIEPGLPPAQQEALLREHNDSDIKLKHVVHHASVGHHVQLGYAVRAASRIGQMAAIGCASRIAMFCAGTMDEGWACYATDLMDEIGFLTPLEHYVQTQHALRMAAREIVDAKLHRGDFTLRQAAEFYQQGVGMTPKAAHQEAVKNSLFPGAAMMYVVGTDMIHQLRREMAAKEGAQFNLRAFHDRFLSYGSVPVSLIAAAMRQVSI